MLAGMAILAHAVVPHHHHDGVFAAIVNVLDDDHQDLFAHHHAGEEHHHDTDAEDCAVSDTLLGVVLLPADKNLVPNNVYLYQSLNLYATIVSELLCQDEEERREQIPIPRSAREYSEYVASSLGLRAPPCC